MKGDKDKVIEVNMDLYSMVPVSTHVLDKESYTWLSYLVNNTKETSLVKNDFQTLLRIKCHFFLPKSKTFEKKCRWKDILEAKSC